MESDNAPRQADTEQERKAYFQPWQDDEGRARCGYPRRNCHKCGYKFVMNDKMVLECPQCQFDRRCQKHPVTGRRRCQKHGGTTPRGPSAPAYRNGKYSWASHLPPDVRKAFNEALRTMNTHNVYGELATVQARMDQLARRLTTSKQSDQWWVRLGKLQQEVRAAVQQGDDKRKDQAFDEMLRLSKQGAQQAEQWQELLQLTKDLARLKETQAKIVRDEKSFLPAADAMAIIETMAHAVKESLVLVRDRWQAFEKTLGDDELFGDILRRGDADSNGKGVERLLARLPCKEMTASFKEADRIVQSRLGQLLGRE